MFTSKDFAQSIMRSYKGHIYFDKCFLLKFIHFRNYM